MAASSHPRVRVKLNFDSNLLPCGAATSYWCLIDTERHESIESYVASLSTRFAVAGRVCLSLDGCILPPWESTLLVRDNDTIRVSPATGSKRKFSEGEEGIDDGVGVTLTRQKKTRAVSETDLDTVVVRHAVVTAEVGNSDSCATQAARKRHKRQWDDLVADGRAVQFQPENDEGETRVEKKKKKKLRQVSPPPQPLEAEAVGLEEEGKKKKRKKRRHISPVISPMESTPLTRCRNGDQLVEPPSIERNSTVAKQGCCDGPDSAVAASSMPADTGRNESATDVTDSALGLTSKLSAALTPAEERLLAEIWPDAKRRRRRRPKKKLKDKLEQIASAALQNLGAGGDVIVRCDYSGRRTRFPSGDSSVVGPAKLEGVAIPAQSSGDQAITSVLPDTASMYETADVCHSDVTLIPAVNQKHAESKALRIKRRSTAACLADLKCTSPCPAAASGHADGKGGSMLLSSGGFMDASLNDSSSAAVSPGNTYYRRPAKQGKKVIAVDEMVAGKPSIFDNRRPSQPIDPGAASAMSDGQMDTSDDYSRYPALQGLPRSGDRIAYKVVEMSENYCPHLSNYKVGTVKGYDQRTGMVEIELDHPLENKAMHGKFHLTLEYGDEILTNEPEPEGRTVTESMLALVSPRLLN